MTTGCNQNTLACCECNTASEQTKTTAISSIFRQDMCICQMMILLGEKLKVIHHDINKINAEKEKSWKGSWKNG